MRFSAVSQSKAYSRWIGGSFALGSPVDKTVKPTQIHRETSPVATAASSVIRSPVLQRPRQLVTSLPKTDMKALLRSLNEPMASVRLSPLRASRDSSYLRRHFHTGKSLTPTPGQTSQAESRPRRYYLSPGLRKMPQFSFKHYN